MLNLILMLAEYNVGSIDKKPKLVIMLECQSIKTFLLKGMLLIGQKKFLLYGK